MLFAERAVFGQNESIRVVLLVLNAVIVSMLAFGTFKSNFGSCRFDCHNKTPYKKITPLRGAYIEFTILKRPCQSFLNEFLQIFSRFLIFFLTRKEKRKRHFLSLPRSIIINTHEAHARNAHARTRLCFVQAVILRVLAQQKFVR